MSQKMELISFKLCPFVQRAIIVLKKKNIDFDITYIDINNPPEWFTKISPLGQVPVLRVEGEVLFESSVIQEYVDEVTPPSLHPDNLIAKAKNRAWIAFAGDLFMAPMKMAKAKDKTAFEAVKADAISKLSRLQQAHSGAMFFNNDEFHLIDTAYAPLFMRFDLLQKATGVSMLAELPTLAAWSKNCLALDCVKDSVVPELPMMNVGMMKHFDGYLATQLS